MKPNKTEKHLNLINLFFILHLFALTLTRSANTRFAPKCAVQRIHISLGGLEDLFCEHSAEFSRAPDVARRGALAEVNEALNP
jgi:hypothetical protein